MQGLILPKEISVAFRQRTALKATVELVDGIAASAPELAPPAGLMPIKRPERVTLGPGDSQVHLAKSARVNYPEWDKSMRNQGTVVLSGVIGKDGKVHNIEILSGLSKSLNKSAIDSVEQWQYKPYLLDGVPVEVDTTVNVVFSLGN